jgi:probable blue pigment (indigoidine) exporter
MSTPPTIPRPVLALTLAAACWGVGTVISKQAVAEVPPLTLLPVQLAVSVGFLLVALRRVGERLPGDRGSRRLARLGILNPGLAYALSLLGLSQISASLSVLLWAAEPLLILLLAAWLLRERIGPSILILSAVALAGMLLVLYDPAASGALLGIALTLGGVGCCAIYTVVARRWLPGAGSTLGVVVTQQAYALGFAVALLGAAALVGAEVLPSRLTPAGVASTFTSGLVYYGLAYWFYLSGLRHVPASIAAASFYLIPVFGVAAATLLGDRLGPAQWLGAVLVMGAVGAIMVRTARTTGPVVSSETPAYHRVRG